MKTYTIAAIPGDGIGTEVVSAGVEVLQALAARRRHYRDGICDRRRHRPDGVTIVGPILAL